MKKETLNVLYTESFIKERIDDLANAINEEYKGTEELVLVCVLRGGFFFFTELSRRIRGPVITMDFITVSSYGNGTESSGLVKMISGGRTEVKGKAVLVIDDICDSGRTLVFLKKLYNDKGASDVKCCTLLDKADARDKEGTDPEYTAILMEGSPFVVGFGLDYDERYRELPALYEISFEEHDREEE